MFWKTLGSKDVNDRVYNKDPTDITEVKKHKARLFKYSNDDNTEKIGELTVVEIEKFTRKDLDSDDVMLLDCFDELFVWLGKESNNEERTEALRAVDQISKSNIIEDTTFASENSTNYSAITFVEDGLFFCFYFILIILISLFYSYYSYFLIFLFLFYYETKI